MTNETNKPTLAANMARLLGKTTKGNFAAAENAEDNGTTSSLSANMRKILKHEGKGE